MDRRIVVGIAVALGGVALLAAAAVVGPPGTGKSDPSDGRAAAANGPPNVLFILWDTARADRMSLYGHSRPTTPRLDAFAAEGAVYERATAPGMWTLNSHAAMFTGLYETSHGATPSHRWLDDRYTTLAESARDAGYDTFFWSSNLIASPMTNLTQGFDTVHTAFPRRGAEQGRYTRPARRHTRGKLLPDDASTEISPAFAGSADDHWGKAVFKDSAPVGHQALVDWLGERQDPSRPFLAYLNLMEAHTPRVPSLSARRRVADDDTIARALATDGSLFAANEYIVGVRDYTEAELGAMSATYDAALVDLDDATGDLLDDLRARGLLEDTVVVVVADHGEALGEHRRLEHRWSMYEQLLHVPLVVWYPPRVEPTRVSERVTTLDVYATLVDLMGVSPNLVGGPHPGDPAASGTSLVGRTSWDRYVFAQMIDPFASQLRNVRAAWPDRDYSEWVKTYCVVYEGAQKLLYASDDQHGLFDVEADPGEATNRLEADPEARVRLLAALEAFERELPVYDPALRGPGDEQSGETQEQRAMLEALGYLTDDDDGGAEPAELTSLAAFCGPHGRKR
jgi:arylsulfatase A-like enzyme